MAADADNKPPQQQDFDKLTESLGTIGARLAHGWSIGRAITAKLVGNNDELRKFGGIIVLAGDAIAEAVKAQKTVNTLFLRTGRDLGAGNAMVSRRLDMAGLSFKEASEVMTMTFMQGINRAERDTLKLLGALQLLGVDSRKVSQMLAMNRHVLGIGTSQSLDLTTAVAESSIAYKISTTAVVDAINSLRETLKSATVTYGPSVANAIQGAMPALMGKFGQEAAGEINKVVSALLSGGPKSAELAARLNIPLADLNVKSSGDVVKLVGRAMAEMDNIIGPLRGQVGAEFSIPALIAAFGNVPEIALLGQRMTEMTDEVRRGNLEQAKMVAQSRILTSISSDMRRSLMLGIMPLIETISIAISPIASIGTILGNILALLTIAFAGRFIASLFGSAGLMGMATKTAPFQGTAMGFGKTAAGAGAGIFAGGIKSGLGIIFGNLLRFFTPLGIVIGAGLFFIPKIVGLLSDSNEEQKKQTAILAEDKNKNQVDIAAQLKAAVRELQGLRLESSDNAVNNLDVLKGVLDVDTRMALGIENVQAGGMSIPFTSNPAAGTIGSAVVNY